MRTALPFGTHLPGLEVIAAAPQGAAAFGGQEACGPLASQTKGPGAVAPGPLGALRARRPSSPTMGNPGGYFPAKGKRPWSLPGRFHGFALCLQK